MPGTTDTQQENSVQKLLREIAEAIGGKRPPASTSSRTSRPQEPTAKRVGKDGLPVDYEYPSEDEAREQYTADLKVVQACAAAGWLLYMTPEYAEKGLIAKSLLSHLAADSVFRTISGDELKGAVLRLEGSYNWPGSEDE